MQKRYFVYSFLTILPILCLQSAHAGFEPRAPVPEDIAIESGIADDFIDHAIYDEPFLPRDAISVRNNQVGRWGGQFGWPLIPLHAILMPNGKILSFGTNGAGTQGGYIYDVWTPGGGHQTLNHNQGNDIFCSAAGLLPGSGNVLIPGGDTRNPINAGIKDTLVYNMNQTNMSRTAYLANARWYPTLTTLPNGESMIFGGRDGNFNPVAVPEIFNGNWRAIWGAANGALVDNGEGKWFYPRNWVAPNGRIFGMTGNLMFFLDWGGNGGTQMAGNLPDKTRSHTSTAVMYQPGKILQVGGSTHGDTQARGSNQAVLVDINSGWPNVQHLPNMAFSRVWGSATVMANGEVLISGGSAYENKDIEAAKTAEIWNPNTKNFRQVARAATSRMYHSMSLLLPDGSVLTGGGGAPGPLNNLNGEIYYPPYLFDGGGNFAQRLNIGGFNTNQAYNNLVNVPYSGPGGVSRVTLVRLGAVTHSFDQAQRFQDLGWSGATGSVNVRMPISPNIAPPGFYMLFLINGSGVPSVARIISLQAGATGGTAPKAGQTYTIVARHSNKCTDVSGSGIPNGTNIQQWVCNGTNAQKFRVENAANGAFKLINVNSNRCVDVAEVSAADGANIHQWDCVGGANQSVRFVAGTNGSYQVKFDHSGKCMDVAGVSAADAANIHQWSCIGGAANQEWFFKQ